MANDNYKSVRMQVGLLTATLFCDILSSLQYEALGGKQIKLPSFKKGGGDVSHG